VNEAAFQAFQLADVVAFLPLFILVAMGCVVLLAETFVQAERRAGLAWLSVGTCVAALIAIVAQWNDAADLAAATSHFQGMLVVDRTSLFIDAVFLLTAGVTILFIEPYMREHGFEIGELYALILFTTAGMMLVAHAAHLVSLLIGIETMSLGAYVLTGCWRRSLRSSEAATKYFLMGAFATGFLVYGIALCYGATGGELSYEGIARKSAEAARQPIFYIGEYFILIALAFKVAAVPFHMWAPDVYEGAPTPVTGFMAAGIKAAAFVGIVRLLGSAFGASFMVVDFTGWASVLSTLAILTMTLGNLAALRQENVKRMLAYSSIAHAGYLLIGVIAMGLGVTGARPALLFYLGAYAVTTLGAFGVVAWIGNRTDERLYVDDWSGLASVRPAIALTMTLFLLSLAGVPPLGGFFGKLYLFRAAMESPQLYWLVVAAVLNSVVSVYYYLRVVIAMYFRDPSRPLSPTDSPTFSAGLLLTSVAVVILGLLPGRVLDWAGAAATTVVKVATER